MNSPKIYFPKDYIQTLNITIISIERDTEFRSKDLIKFKHHCCGVVKSLTGSKLSQKITKAQNLKLVHPRLCTSCAASNRVNKKEDPETVLSFHSGPTWPAPSFTLKSSYYQDSINVRNY